MLMMQAMRQSLDERGQVDPGSDAHGEAYLDLCRRRGEGGGTIGRISQQVEELADGSEGDRCRLLLADTE